MVNIPFQFHYDERIDAIEDTKSGINSIFNLWLTTVLSVISSCTGHRLRSLFHSSTDLEQEPLYLNKWMM